MSKQIIAVNKEPIWNIYTGVFLFMLGFFGFIPFKFEAWYLAANTLHILLIIGALLLLRGSQKIGWHLSLEGNVLYYQKFNLLSSWKKRRSSEFSLPTQKIKTIKIDGTTLRITYEPGRELKFNTRGLDSYSYEKLNRLIKAIKV